MNSLAAAFQSLVSVFDGMKIDFFVGGSVASSAHGLPRQTNDIDIVADLALGRVAEFCAALIPDFYIDRETVEAAVIDGRPFNAIHLRGAYKFDIFPAGNDRFARSQLARRCRASTIVGTENIEFPVASAEDTILAKLVWFRKGGDVSDRQWHDILGVIAVQADRLDRAYLKAWATELNVADLLSKALGEE